MEKIDRVHSLNGLRAIHRKLTKMERDDNHSAKTKLMRDVHQCQEKAYVCDGDNHCCGKFISLLQVQIPKVEARALLPHKTQSCY